MPVPIAPRAPPVSKVIPFPTVVSKNRQKLYSFDVYEHASGLVSIDAVVPLSVALAMLRMLD